MIESLLTDNDLQYLISMVRANIERFSVANSDTERMRAATLQSLVIRLDSVISARKFETERALFEADAKSYEFSLDRCVDISGEPWDDYVSMETGYRWSGWLAAKGL